MVHLLLSNGASVNAVDSNGLNALLHAIKSFSIHSVDIVRQLIDAGSDVNFINEKGVEGNPEKPLSALHIAVNRDDLVMLDYLLKRGANPNHANQVGRSILSFALEKRRNSLRRIELLISHGADMYDSGSCNSKSPLELLVSTNRVAEVECLLKHGLDLGRYRPRAPNDFSPLHEAILCSKTCHMLSVLLRYDTKGLLDLGHVDSVGRSPLSAAAEDRSSVFVKLLVEQGADVNHVDSKGYSPLDYVSHLAKIKTGTVNRIQILVEAGANPRKILNKLVKVCSFDENGQPKAYPTKTECHRLKQAYCVIKYRILYESKKAVAEPIEHVDVNLPVRLKQYIEICKAEIILLKNSPIHKSVTYYHMLADEKCYQRVRDHRAYTSFIKKNLENRFPVYGRDLRERFDRARDLHEIWETAVKKLGTYLRLNYDAYYLIIMNILKRLQNDDLRSVAES
ncbi:hypothetical protein QAD02_004183 [Eretmocerus hayati]|uniref:Uncharacterized protein n=1 Tax=Eretmocerus hayati TaxID=131215 RepID=A0ACC2NP91_9HYME|nr:hypothetical protein QAD02_004183 [Eretmocerus hayati]